MKTMLSGGIVSCTVWPRRSMRVSSEVACPAGVVKTRSSWATRKGGKPGQADLAGVIEGQVLREPAEQLRQDDELSRNWVREVSRNPDRVASAAHTPAPASRAATALAARS